MMIGKIDHIGINVNDFDAAKSFFIDFGLELQGEDELQNDMLDRIVGLKGAKTQVAFFRTPDGEANIELIKYHAPADENGVQKSAANTLGIRHIAFVVTDIDALVAQLKAKGTETVGEVVQYEDSYKLCYIRGPEGIILELAEELKPT